MEGHAFTLIGIAEVEDKNGNALRFVKLRNPWGTLEWKGAWSDGDDERWDTLGEEAKAALGTRKAGDGMFRLEWSSFVRYMEDVVISEVAMR